MAPPLTPPRLAFYNWLFICGLSFCLGGAVVLGLMPGLTADCYCPLRGGGSPVAAAPPIAPAPADRSSNSSAAAAARVQPQSPHDVVATHKLAVLVPFRDRFEELLQFVPHLTSFLKRQGVVHHIFVLNQVDRYRFNRASLINVGYQFSQEIYDYIGMHDVDLLPLNPNLHYDYPPERGPLHIASPKFHPKYHYETFVGGILLVRRDHFEQVNGMSNKYWGWGLEDDEFYVRLRDAGLSVSRPDNIQTGVNDTFSHIHNRYHRKRDTQKCFNQKEVTRKRDRLTGLNTLKYKIPKVHELSIDGIAITVLNIQLECDAKETPWCDCVGNAAAAAAEST